MKNFSEVIHNFQNSRKSSKCRIFFHFAMNVFRLFSESELQNE